MNWILKFLKHPKETGSVAPSSSALGRMMTKNISPDARVLELGPGNGAITAYLVQRLANPSQLIGVECDSDFVQICKRRFPLLEIVHDHAEHFLDSTDRCFDAIVSGIPLSNIDAPERLRLLKRISDHLSEKGQFILFQYSPRIQRQLSRIFQIADIGFVPWNIPPALVYTCRLHPQPKKNSSQDGMNM